MTLLIWQHVERKKKSNKSIDIKNFFFREDEIGLFTKSIDEMTKELQKRTTRAETFSNDLAHEIRNPSVSYTHLRAHET